MLRRARGYAPAPISLPAGFETVPAVLALGGELKTTFCLVRPGQAILSQHLGDLEQAAAYQAYRQTLDLYLKLFEYQPQGLVVDCHPEYLSTKLGQELAQTLDIPIVAVQHHHAHIAACMVDNHLPLSTTPILGIALDGLGYGDDHSLWGGEFLLADYRRYQRLAHLKPVAMLGGTQAIRQPWRNTYAHLIAAFGSWEVIQQEFAELPLISDLAEQPRPWLDAMLAQGLSSPLASSAGRLFDAVAAALGICYSTVSYEGQAAMALEALIEPGHLQIAQHSAYEFAVQPGFAPAAGAGESPLVLDPTPLWQGLLTDRQRGTPIPLIAARFHVGLGNAIAQLAHRLTQQHALTTVALSGGVFQNQILATQVQCQLKALGLTVLTHRQVPANDGGLSLGQAAIAAAQGLDPPPSTPRSPLCA
jgi:hydrogenase maturation protein HypF